MKLYDEFENFGDVSIEQGSVFVRKIGKTEYELYSNQEIFDTDGMFLLSSVCIDVDDSWIELEDVYATCGNSEGHQLAVDILWYYGSANCGGSEEIVTIEEVKQKLIDYNVVIEF